MEVFSNSPLNQEKSELRDILNNSFSQNISFVKIFESIKEKKILPGSVSFHLRTILQDWTLDENSGDNSNYLSFQEFILDFSFFLSNENFTKPYLPLVILTDLLDWVSLRENERFFTKYLEGNLSNIMTIIAKEKENMNDPTDDQKTGVKKKKKSKIPFTSLKLLYIGNKLFSQTIDSLFKYRILLFLSIVHPLLDRSGLNLMLSYSDNYNDIYKSSIDAVFNEEIDKKSPFYSAFKKFWDVQCDINNTLLYINNDIWSKYINGIKDIIKLFKNKQERLIMREKNNEYLTKSYYITSMKNFDYQLEDFNFQNTILIQVLISMHRITVTQLKPSKKHVRDNSNSDINVSVTKEQKDELDKVYTKVLKLIQRNGKNGSVIEKVLTQQFEREKNWIIWKEGNGDTKMRCKPIKYVTMIKEDKDSDVANGTMLDGRFDFGDNNEKICPELKEMWDMKYDIDDNLKYKNFENFENSFVKEMHPGNEKRSVDVNDEWRFVREFGRKDIVKTSKVVTEEFTKIYDRFYHPSNIGSKERIEVLDDDALLGSIEENIRIKSEKVKSVKKKIVKKVVKKATPPPRPPPVVKAKKTPVMNVVERKDDVKNEVKVKVKVEKKKVVIKREKSEEKKVIGSKRDRKSSSVEKGRVVSSDRRSPKKRKLSHSPVRSPRRVETRGINNDSGGGGGGGGRNVMEVIERGRRRSDGRMVVGRDHVMERRMERERMERERMERERRERREHERRVQYRRREDMEYSRRGGYKRR